VVADAEVIAMNEDRISKLLNRIGNDIVCLIAAVGNLVDDYQILVEELGKSLGDKLKDSMGMRDRLIAVVTDKNGNVKQTYDSGWSRNGITNAGFAEVAGLAIGISGVAPFGYIAIGTGTTPFSPTQTGLVTEVKRKQATASRVTTSVINDTLQLEAKFSASDGLSGTMSITESGVFNASSGGVMLCRQTFDVLNLNWGAGDELTITWKVQMKQVV